MKNEHFTVSLEADAEGSRTLSRGQRGKVPAKEEDVKASDSNPEDKHTRPPRVSFGVELEFLVPKRPEGAEPDDKISGIAPVHDEYDGQAAVARLLRKHGFSVQEPQNKRSSTEPTQPPWVVQTDGSVEETGDRLNLPRYHCWDAVEVASPAMYACDESFKLVAAVVRLLTTNLRARVNESCGLHVHVGNGPHQMDMRALRNYAAVQWASEPVLSTLHCPTRSFARWSRSIRRSKSIGLTVGMTASSALSIMAEDPRFIPRFVGRARKLGEAPVASRVKRRQHVEDMGQQDPLDCMEPEWQSDDSDWEDKKSKPFERPKKTKGQKRGTTEIPWLDFLNSSVNEAQLDSETTRRKLPPQIVFPVSPSRVSGRSSGSVPFLDEKRTRTKPMSAEEVRTLNKSLKGERYPQAWQDPIEANTKLTWKGIAELMACDVGTHQVACLMSSSSGEKGFTVNWQGQCKGELHPDHPRTFHPTVEARLAGGSLDAEWVVIWIKIQCRMLEWARDAEPSQLMQVIGKLSRDDHSQECTYDVVDFLRDIGLYTEAMYCHGRLQRAEEAWFECMLMTTLQSREELDNYEVIDYPSGEERGSEADQKGQPKKDPCRKP
ncbi:hypothetical protein F66182_713 [Fusarium sp. NRRL 66182]|nr:hypothetical protein F66182_713 [Fusarium sp. NRRL 66182]